MKKVSIFASKENDSNKLTESQRLNSIYVNNKKMFDSFCKKHADLEPALQLFAFGVSIGENNGKVKE